MEWLWAGVAIVVGLMTGAAASAAARTFAERRKGKIGQLAPAIASLTFSLILVAGLLVALGFVRPASLEKLRDDTIDYLPRVLSALIVVILGGVAGTLASAAAEESLGTSMGRLGLQISQALKTIITLFAAILAASQLGVDTTVINIVIAAATAGMALAFALVVGFGSRPVATEIARGRALRRLISPGDQIANDRVQGIVVALHPTNVELDHDGTTSLIPNSDIADTHLTITRLD